MIVRHNGALSDVFDLPGGGCQGTNLGILSFLVYVNSCGVPLDGLLKCVCSSHTGDLCHPLLPIPDPHISNKYARFKYIDDLAAAEAVATSDLEVIPHEMPRPLEYRDRTLHHYPKEKSVLQKILLQIDDFCDAQQMVINEKKTKTAIFHTGISKDFHPRLTNSDGHIYQNTETFKLLGVDFQTNSKTGLKWETYLNSCMKRAYSKMWILRRLSELGVCTEDLLMTYCMRIRIHVEANVPLWTFSISKTLSSKIEKIQRIATYIILGPVAHQDYYCNLAILDLIPLENRREDIAKQFAQKLYKNPVHNIFQKAATGHTHIHKRKVIVPHARRARYDRSSVPSLARLIKMT